MSKPNDTEGEKIMDSEVIHHITNYESEDDPSLLTDENPTCGYQIITSKRRIYVSIDNKPLCCEDWGYMSSEDDLSYYRDAELYDIKAVDSGLKVYCIKNDSHEETNTFFVNFETSKGTFQIVMYNSHNGYYGHCVKVISVETIADGVI